MTGLQQLISMNLGEILREAICEKTYSPETFDYLSYERRMGQKVHKLTQGNPKLDLEVKEILDAFVKTNSTLNASTS